MFPPKVSISFIILLNNGRPGTLADCFSTISAEISIFSRTAYSRNSVSCASILKTCLSSTSVLLRAYKKYFLGKGFAKTSADLFLNLDVANGKGGVWGGIFHLLRCFLLANFG